MDRVQAARVFVEIADRGSMTAAADYLDMSRSMVTRYLSEIESWANARLLHRSTRRLSLTPAGETVLAQCRGLLAIADEIPLGPTSQADKPKGHLRISCAHLAAEHVLVPALKTYCESYPDVTVEMLVSNATVNLVDERVDLAMRITSELDPNVIARPLGKCSSVLVASPEYIRQHGDPKSLNDLKRHQCLIYSYFGKHGLWRFQDEEGQVAVPVTGNIIANDSGILMIAALEGLGISYQPVLDVAGYIQAGTLVEVLPHCQPIELGIYGVYRSRKQVPQALRLLLDMLLEQ